MKHLITLLFCFTLFTAHSQEKIKIVFFEEQEIITLEEYLNFYQIDSGKIASEFNIEIAEFDRMTRRKIWSKYDKRVHEICIYLGLEYKRKRENGGHKIHFVSQEGSPTRITKL